MDYYYFERREVGGDLEVGKLVGENESDNNADFHLTIFSEKAIKLKGKPQLRKSFVKLCMSLLMLKTKM